jgi:hypothetical protein
VDTTKSINKSSEEEDTTPKKKEVDRKFRRV